MRDWIRLRKAVEKKGWKAITDEDGDVVNRYHYTDSWGNFLLNCPSENKGKPCIPNRYAFTGREWDPDIALYHYRARWYDPDTKRFTQEDPVFESTNKYKYVGNRPIKYSDPTGKESVLVVLIIVGAVVALGAYAYEKGKKAGDGLGQAKEGLEKGNWQRATESGEGLDDYQNRGKDITEGSRDIIDGAGGINDGWGGVILWILNRFFNEEEEEDEEEKKRQCK
jgi:RHS repeat-associated protein